MTEEEQSVFLILSSGATPNSRGGCSPCDEQLHDLTTGIRGSPGIQLSSTDEADFRDCFGSDT
jgi:hypothetical protein